MAAERDAIIPVEQARQLAQRYPAARYLELPGAGHNDWLGRLRDTDWDALGAAFGVGRDPSAETPGAGFREHVRQPARQAPEAEEHSARRKSASKPATRPHVRGFRLGPEHASLYNDGYIPILATKHSRALGRPYREVWPEIWEAFRPILVQTMAGHAHFFETQPVPLAGRPGRPVSWFTFSWTPLCDDSGAVAGVFCMATETADKMLAGGALRESERRLQIALEAADLGTWDLDLVGDHAVGSLRHDQMFGYA